jgi:hypothetical protein
MFQAALTGDKKVVVREVELTARGIPDNMGPESVFAVIIRIAREEGVFISDGDWVSPNALLRIWYK